MSQILVTPRGDRIPDDAERLWSPQPKQAEFLRRREYEAGYGGAKGPGKTDAVIAAATRQLHHPDYHGAIFRRTFTELQEIMDRMHKLYPRLGGTWNEGKKRWMFETGARTSLFYLERESDKHKHDGKEYHFLGFDQLEQMTESMYLHLHGCSRTTKPGLTLQVRSTFNPGGPGHLFVKRRFVDLGHARPIHDRHTGLSRVFIAGLVWDNQELLRNDPAYIQRLLAEPDEALRKGYLEGDFNTFAGQYFKSWNPRLHTCAPFEIPEHWSRTGGMDYGYSPSPGVIEWTAWDEFQRPVTYKEMLCEEMSSAEIAEGIVARTECEAENQMIIRGDTQMWVKNPETGVSIADSINEALAARGSRVTLIQANKDRIPGWHRVKDYMDPRRPDPEGGKPRPYWRIMRPNEEGEGGAPYLLETMPAQIHDDALGKTGDLKKGATDHACDAIRYDFMGQPPLTPIPIEKVRGSPHHKRVQGHTARLLRAALREQREEAEADEEAAAERLQQHGIDLGELPGHGASSEDLSDMWG